MVDHSLYSQHSLDHPKSFYSNTSGLDVDSILPDLYILNLSLSYIYFILLLLYYPTTTLISTLLENRDCHC